MKKYAVISHGKVLDGFVISNVCQNVATLLKVKQQIIHEKLIGTEGVKLRSFSSFDEAYNLEQKLSLLGLDVDVKPYEADNSAVNLSGIDGEFYSQPELKRSKAIGIVSTIVFLLLVCVLAAAVFWFGGNS